jgi:hypothetical protein
MSIVTVGIDLARNILTAHGTYDNGKPQVSQEDNLRVATISHRRMARHRASARLCTLH